MRFLPTAGGAAHPQRRRLPTHHVEAGRGGRRILGRAFTHSDIQTLVTSDFGGPGPRDAVYLLCMSL